MCVRLISPPSGEIIDRRDDKEEIGEWHEEEYGRDRKTVEDRTDERAAERDIEHGFAFVYEESQDGECHRAAEEYGAVGEQAEMVARVRCDDGRGERDQALEEQEDDVGPRDALRNMADVLRELVVIDPEDGDRDEAQDEGEDAWQERYEFADR